MKCQNGHDPVYWLLARDPCWLCGSPGEGEPAPTVNGRWDGAHHYEPSPDATSEVKL